jgi:transcriptional regulator with XRE-family HTH domain
MSRGERLKKVRLTFGFTQGKAAELSGILQKEISLLENDKRENIPTEYINWLGSLEVNLNWIFLNNGSQFVSYQNDNTLQLTGLSNRVNLIQVEIEELTPKSQTGIKKKS